VIDRPSPNFDDRGAGVNIDILLLHYTGMETAEAALQRLCDPEAKVSAHYCIDEDGTTYRLVSEEHRAWHAGVACWDGNAAINARSIGIELVNPGHEFGYRPFPGAQMAALKDLALNILSRHPIPPARVLGHSDVAPARKEDPGELFDWWDLAENGIGLWPNNPAPCEVPDENTLRTWLSHYGYDTRELPLDVLLTAFQRHFRPEAVTGAADAETVARLNCLLRLVG